MKHREDGTWLLVVLFCVLTMAAEEMKGHEVATDALFVDSSMPRSSSLPAVLCESLVAAMCILIMTGVLYIYSWSSIDERVASAEREKGKTEQGERDAREREKERERTDEEHKQSVTPVHLEADTAMIFVILRSHERDADHSHSLAMIQEMEGNDKSAVQHYLKAAALYQAVGEQERKYLVDVLATIMTVGESVKASLAGLFADYAAMGKYAEQHAMHAEAALRYQQLAKEAAAADQPVEARAMSWAAAEQYEVAAGNARSIGDHIRSKIDYAKAVKLYTAVGDVDKVRQIHVAEARTFEADGGDAMACGNYIWAENAYMQAANLYTALDDVGKADEMREAAAKCYQVIYQRVDQQ